MNIPSVLGPFAFFTAITVKMLVEGKTLSVITTSTVPNPKTRNPQISKSEIRHPQISLPCFLFLVSCSLFSYIILLILLKISPIRGPSLPISCLQLACWLPMNGR